jgi:hypothetical protein
MKGKIAAIPTTSKKEPITTIDNSQQTLTKSLRDSKNISLLIFSIIF